MSGRFGVNLGLERFSKQLDRLTKPTRDLQRGVERWQRVIDQLRIKHEAATEFLIRAGWPPPLDYPAKGLDKLAHLFETGEIDEESLCRVFGQFYDENQLENMLQNWRANSHISQRIFVLEEAIANFLDCRYASCIVLIFPNIEGAIGDYVERKPNPGNDIAKLFDSRGFEEATRKFYVDVALKSFDWSDDEILGLSRHAILHGKAVRFGTQGNALKAILMFDAIQRAIADKVERRSDD